MATSDRIIPERRRWLAATVGVVCLAACAVGALTDRAVFSRSYLVAVNFWLGIAAGSMAILMVYHLTGGGWGRLSRRILEAAVRTLPIVAVLFIPVLLSIEEIYSWARPGGSDELPHEKTAHYLNGPAFIGRTAIYFAVWIVLGFLLNRWSRLEDRSGNRRLAGRMRMLSGPGLVLYVLTATFAGVDWIMSLQPHWYSTIFGAIFFIGQALAAMSFLIVVLVPLAGRPPLVRLASPVEFRNLGNLLLMLVVFWTYVAFSQYLLTWAGNLPKESAWYLPRTQGGWEWLAVAMILGQFVLPFALLLFRVLKQNPAVLGRIALGILAINYLTLIWQIIPAFGPPGLPDHWLDFVAAAIAFAGVGGVWLAVFFTQLDRMPLVPQSDPVALEPRPHE